MVICFNATPEAHAALQRVLATGHYADINAALCAAILQAWFELHPTLELSVRGYLQTIGAECVDPEPFADVWTPRIAIDRIVDWSKSYCEKDAGADQDSISLMVWCLTCWGPTVVQASAALIGERVPRGIVIEPIDDDMCAVSVTANTVEMLALYLGMLDADFTVTEPPELLARLSKLSGRFSRAVPR